MAINYWALNATRHYSRALYRDHLILFPQQPFEAGNTVIPVFRGGNTETQRSQATCSRSHSQQAIKPGFKHKPCHSEPVLLTIHLLIQTYNQISMIPSHKHSKAAWPHPAMIPASILRPLFPSMKKGPCIFKFRFLRKLQLTTSLPSLQKAKFGLFWRHDHVLVSVSQWEESLFSSCVITEQQSFFFFFF